MRIKSVHEDVTNDIAEAIVELVGSEITLLNLAALHCDLYDDPRPHVTKARPQNRASRS